MKEDGVVDMPMRLLIIAAILVITVPVVLGIVNYYSVTATEQQLASGVDYLKKQIQIVYSQGENASMVVRVSFPFGTEFVKIGGHLGSDNSHLIRYKLRNGIERYTVVHYGNIAILMTAKNGSTLTVVGGTYDFILTKAKATTDLDGDGQLDDYYVTVEVRT